MTEFARKYFRVLTGLCSLVPFAPLESKASNLDLPFAVAATAEDLGPQDGTFDAFTPLNFGSVNNNGFTSLRTAMEFNILSIPPGSSIHSATLTVHISFVEGTRSLALHGYTGDGTVQLMDFSRNGLLANSILAQGDSHDLAFDVTGFVSGLVNSGNGFAGFNFREDPANTPNFTVFNIDMTGASAPLLSIDFVPVPEPSVICLLGIGLVGLFFLQRNSKRMPT